jgi:hypothetical protein
MAIFNKFNQFTEDLAEKVHDLGSNQLKIMLTNTSPNAADVRFDTSVDLRLEATSNALDLVTGGGYTAGGENVVVTASLQTSGTYQLTANDVVFTATTGFGPFQYAVIYNSAGGTASTRPLIAWWIYPGSAITLLATETFTVDLDQINGILQLV